MCLKSLFSSPTATPVRYLVAIDLKARVTMLNVCLEPKADIQFRPSNGKLGGKQENSITANRIISGRVLSFEDAD